MKLKDSKTAKNLMTAFAGETQAYARYTMYAKVARNEGYVQISEIFLETARNEMEHAKRFYKYLREELTGEAVGVNQDDHFPVMVGTTEQNLKAAAEGENHEWTDMYVDFANIAKEEGFSKIANTFLQIAKVEEAHEKRFLKLLKNIKDGVVFQREMETYWICQNCGYIYKGKKAPKTCPACEHGMEFFKLFVEDY